MSKRWPRRKRAPSGGSSVTLGGAAAAGGACGRAGGGASWRTSDGRRLRFSVAGALPGAGGGAPEAGDVLGTVEREADGGDAAVFAGLIAHLEEAAHLQQPGDERELRAGCGAHGHADG